MIQAVNWARELGLTVLIDLHGAPGSQNGQDNSGLIGPTLFPTNSSNLDRTINVLKNLTSEFSQTDIYGDSTVIGIELLNEPRLSDTFTMTQLKDFYTQASEAINGIDSNMVIVMHGKSSISRKVNSSVDIHLLDRRFLGSTILG